MRILTRYLLRQIWVPALCAAAVISMVVVAGSVQKEVAALLNDLPIAQVTLTDISRISLYALPTLAGYILPITFLLGILLAFARSAENNEIIAMKAAGIPLKRMILPILGAGALLSVAAFVVLDQGQVWAYKRLGLLLGDLHIRLTLDMLPTGVMHEYGGWRVYIGAKDADNTLRDIVVVEPHDDGQATTYYAASAALVKEAGRSKLVLKQGYCVRPPQDDKVLRMSFDEFTHTVPGLLASGLQSAREGRTLRQLYATQAQLAEEFATTQAIPIAMELRKERIEFAERLSFPLMCLAVCFVGAPMGARMRRAGRSFAFAGGLFIVIIYLVLWKAVEPPIFYVPSLGMAMFLSQVPNLLLCTFGFVLWWRVDRV